MPAPTEYFVSENGNDQNHGDVESQPFATYTAALSRVNEGDIITQLTPLRGYGQVFDSDINNIPLGITIRSKPGNKFDITPPGHIQVIKFHSNLVVGMRFENLVLNAMNLPDFGTFMPIIYINTGDGISFKNVDVINHRDCATQFHYESRNCIWDGGSILDSGDHAMYMVGCYNTFRNMIIGRAGRYGFHCYSKEGFSNDTASYNLFENNYIFDVGLRQPTDAAMVFAWGHDNLARNNRIERAPAGIVNYTQARNNKAYYNSIRNCKAAIAEQYYAGKLDARGNILAFSSKAAYYDYERLSSEVPAGNFVGDPYFKSNGFYLLEGSPCIGTGGYISEVPVDADGVTRKNPTSYGCYEYISSSVPPEPEPEPDEQVFDVVIRGKMVARKIQSRR